MPDKQRYVVATDDGLTFGFTHEGKIKLEPWQKLVGGNIEVTYPVPSVQLLGICWEEARIYGRPVNRMATLLASATYGYTQVGDFVYCGDTSNGDFTGLTDEQLLYVNAACNMAGAVPVHTFQLTLDETLEVMDARRADRS